MIDQLRNLEVYLTPDYLTALLLGGIIIALPVLGIGYIVDSLNLKKSAGRLMLFCVLGAFTQQYLIDMGISPPSWVYGVIFAIISLMLFQSVLRLLFGNEVSTNVISHVIISSYKLIIGVFLGPVEFLLKVLKKGE